MQGLEQEIPSEVEKWRKQLEGLKIQGVRVAKLKLIELDRIRPGDLGSLQNWLSCLFWMAKKNKMMAVAENNIKMEGQGNG